MHASTGGLYDGRERAQADINTARDMFGFKIEFYFDIEVKKQNREFLFVGNWASWEVLKEF